MDECTNMWKERRSSEIVHLNILFVCEQEKIGEITVSPDKKT